MAAVPSPENDPASLAEHTIELLGAALTVPADSDCWLRAFQNLAARDARLFFHSGFYCWNDRCKKCFMSLRPRGAEIRRVQACQTAPRPGDAITELPADMGFSV